MAAFHDIQPTFAGGEITPAMYSRVDMAKYKTALKTARNGIVHPQGGFSGRTGFRYVAAAKHSNGKCRLISFQFSNTQSYMLEFGDQYIRFYKNGAQIVIPAQPAYSAGTAYSVGQYVSYNSATYYCIQAGTGHTPGSSPAYWVAQTAYEIPSPYLEADLPLLKWTQSANTMYFAHPNYPPQTLVRVTDALWVLSAFPFTNGPYLLSNTDLTNVMTVDGHVAGSPTQWGLSSVHPVFQAGHVSRWFKVTAHINGQSTHNTLSNGNATGNIMAYKQWKATTTGTWAGSVTIYAFIRGVNVVVATLSGNNDVNFNTYGPIPSDVPCLIVAQATLSSGSVTVNLSSDAYDFGYNFQIAAVTNSTTATAIFPNDQLAISTSFTSTDWAEGSWSSIRSWPAVVGFYQDRLGWSSSLSEPIALWLSQTGNYLDYGVSDPLVDSDAINVNLPSRKFNSISNLIQLRKLVAISASGEFSIGPGASGVLAPTSIDQRQEGFRGCSSVNPLVIGYQAIYIQPLGTVVRNLSYQLYTDTMSGDNISLMANHLFQNYTILDMTYCQEPDSIAYMVRSDGQLLALTYLIEQQVVGWTHFDTQGSFIACASMPASNYDELWVVVERSFGTFIERLAQPLPSYDTEDQFHVDCGIDYDGAPTTGISGLDHLEGQSVMALADGHVQGPFLVVNGSITLTQPASLVHIGLGYMVDMETLNVELAGQDGTSQGRRQRVSQLSVRFMDSLGGYAGPDADHLHPIVASPAVSLGSPRPLFTGDYKVPITPNWQSNGRVFLRQTDPLPFNVTGLFPIVESGNL